ncbi:MAG: hypothetical protein QNJ62_06135 [Methyloceanibacter sp.]|nr:hypothetical protein [Methyloceanibacter sp.]
MDEDLCNCFGDLGLHASTHVPLGCDKECCDLCGKPIQEGATDVLTALNSMPVSAEPSKTDKEQPA